MEYIHQQNLQRNGTCHKEELQFIVKKAELKAQF